MYEIISTSDIRTVSSCEAEDSLVNAI